MRRGEGFLLSWTDSITIGIGALNRIVGAVTVDAGTGKDIVTLDDSVGTNAHAYTINGDTGT